MTMAMQGTAKKTRADLEAQRRSYGYVVEALLVIDFVHAAIPTRVQIERDGINIQLDTKNRETGRRFTIALRWDIPTVTSRECAIQWIYESVRYAWVHELNEAMFVDGVRRRDLHDVKDSKAQTVDPPDEPKPLQTPMCAQPKSQRGGQQERA